MKIIVGIAIVAAEAALMFIPGLQVAAIWAMADYLGIGAFTAVMVGIAAIGMGLVIGGISDLLFHTPGSAIASRNPIAPWQVIYGQQMVGGTIVDIGETGSNDRYLHLVIVTACHQTNSFQGLWLDGKEVYLNGDPMVGCYDDKSTHYDLSGMPYNFKGRVYCQAFLGTATQSACADYINRSYGHWTAEHTLSGRSYIYLRLQYDVNVFPNGMPGVKSLWNGKTDVLDPRSGLRGYSTNAALCINDFLTNQDYGFRCATTEINQTALIAAANLCASYTTSGTIEPLYSLNGVFNLSSTPGEILNNMLSACAGQISYNAGQFSIYAGSWRGAVCTLDQTHLVAPIKYKPKRKLRELYNSVRGTFLSPNGPVIDRGPGIQTGQVNPWDGQWTYTDVPDYAEDTKHGYSSNAYLTADGQSLYLNTKFPFTTSVSTCQRLAKIMLERNRQQGSGTLQCGLSCYNIQPLDIVEFNYPRFGWVNKLFEVTGTRLTFKAEQGRPAVPIYEIDIAETDPKVYSWAGGVEELSLNGQASPLVPSDNIVTPPTNLTLTDDTATSLVLANGTSMSRLLVAWTAPLDPFVTQGGTIQIQYQLSTTTTLQPVSNLNPTQNSDGTWTSGWVHAGTVNGDANFFYIDGISEYQGITVQIQAVRANGASSGWVSAANGLHIINRPRPVFSAGTISMPAVQVAFSSTPVFDFSLGATQIITLTGDVTSTSTANATNALYTIVVMQDAVGGHTYTWPSNFRGAAAISPGNGTAAANTAASQTFVYDPTLNQFIAVTSLTYGV